MPNAGYRSSAYAALVGKRPRANEEEQLQAAVWSHILQRGTKDTIAYAVPNGGPRSKASAGKLKGQGVVPGVADMMFVLADGTAAAMEFKIGRNTQSDAQIAFQARCEAIGVPYVVCWNLDNALAILEGWGVLRPDVEL